MNRLIQFSMKNVAAVIIIVTMLLGGGLVATSGLKMENLPDISLPYVVITTGYPAPPQDVMDEISAPIEKKVSGLERLKTMTSTSSDSFSTVVLEFEEGTDAEKKKQEIDGMLQELDLPEAATRPKAATFGNASTPAYYLVLYAEEGMSQTELDNRFTETIKPGLQAVKGLDHLDAIGDRKTSLDIKLDAAAMAAYGLSPETVAGALRAEFAGGPAGSVDFNGNSMMARVKGETNSVYNLERLELQTGTGEKVPLMQVAKVEAVSQSKFIARLDDKPALGINLFKMKHANAVNFASDVDQLIERWKTEMPEVQFKTIFDTSVEVKESIAGMLREGIVGALLASLMILLFLRNFRMTLIVLVSIPLSILIALLVMRYLDISLNIMTLGGMFIAVGRVVDDSIVVIENIYSHLQRAQERNESVIRLATKEVASAITSSTLTTVGVFAPIGMVSGIAGQFFQPFAITLSVALLASLLVALTVIPMLAKLLVLGGKVKHHEEKQGAITAWYRKVLEWSLSHRFITLLLAGVLFFGSIVTIVPQLAMAFLPEGKPQPQFYFNVKLPYETSLATTDLKVKEIEDVLSNAKDQHGNKQFLFVESLVGYGQSSEALPYRAQIFTEVNADSDVEQVRRAYKEELLAMLPAGSEVETSTLAGDGPSGSAFAYALKGDDPLQLKQAAAMIKEKMLEIKELTDVKDSLSDVVKEVEIAVDPQKARQYGYTVAEVRAAVRNFIAAEELGELKLDHVMYRTTLSVEHDDKNSLDKLADIQLRAAGSGGEVVLLRDVAKLREAAAPAAIERDRQEQVVRVSAKIVGSDTGGITERVTGMLDQIPLPEGIKREVSGVAEDMNDSFMQLGVAMVAAVFIVYLIMVLAFGNASAPFAILFSLPLAAIGGFLALLLTGESLNVTSMIGFMMLIGIVVTNAIVYIDLAQQLRQQGYTVRHALIEAGVSRLRPIIMTALATIVALLPLALGFAHGTIISKGLAVVVIGGLTTSTLLTLVVVPVVYEWIEAFKQRMAQLFRRKGASA
ncbi:efflux RND transporter permease subunit [Paenibacillus sp. GCM10027626]|uniref:efflux RND transporter permease subunit n=1 Tax=Paenibacillus sp. GCM10027626 TaxID=3273411 RepID=UPI00362B9EB4